MSPVMLKLVGLYECTDGTFIDSRLSMAEYLEGERVVSLVSFTINDGAVPSDMGVSLPQPRFKLIISFH
jgi:hypothetical protein